MKKLTCLIVQCALLAISVAYSFWVRQKMPATVPTHWGLSGKPDAYGSPDSILWLMPITGAFILALTFALPFLSPKKYEISRFARTFYYAMCLVALLMTALHLVILNATTHANMDLSRVMFAVLFVFFALLGNVLGKVKQNFYMGIRTPWTIASPQVWDKTHREAGHLWVAGSAVGMLLALLGVPMLALTGLLLVLAFVPVYRSYWWYQKLERGTVTTPEA